MKRAHHIKLLIQATLVWAGFWVAGLPHYYQQYSALALGVGCTVLSVLISFGALWVLLITKPQYRMSRALWVSFYFSLPFAVLDTLYCGVYLGHGSAYLVKYWYLTVFYFTPWITFAPMAWLLQRYRL